MIVVHIGPQKTGSKAIQTFLQHNSVVDGATVCFPGEEIWHRSIADDLAEGRTARLEAAIVEIRETDANLSILSSEDFHSLPQERLEPFAGLGVRFVVFLRRQDELINSYLNQLYKAHRVSFSRAQERTDRLLNEPVFDYEAMIRRFETVGEVVPVLYRPGSSVSDFFGALGLRVTEPERDLNVRASCYLLATLHEAKRIYGESERLPDVVELVRNRVRDGWLLNPHPMLIGEDEGKTIRDRYAASNESVRLRFFPGRPSLFPSHSLPEGTNPIGKRIYIRKRVLRSIMKEIPV